MSGSHDHDHHHHDHDHSHLTETELRVRALETLFTEKGYVDPRTLETILETYETKIGPRNGARVVARAWSDPAYMEWLKTDGSAAIASLGYAGRQGEHIVALINTPEVHNVVVCTLCSCYPWPVLGLPPSWYKSSAYRSRVVIEPRAVLSEFGLVLPETTRVRVWDSTSEMRYLVIPMRPGGVEGWAEDKLADLVNRDSMIGTRLATSVSELNSGQTE
ncbi:nitrile hydratase subunit alpha [Agrobacterium sp. T29]|uniref:nitrile hydratase subunit alpha n=1 Tax=Agrobacterium sp. T29 TaxID=2580515 RepID=UPI00115C654E|nr:nitrile hydratase subunit alpha [Agrobacterium sp. T29]